MLIYFFTDSKTIYGINSNITKEDAYKSIKDGCKWLDVDKIPYLSENEEWYLTVDNQIRVRKIKKEEKTKVLTEQEEIALDTALNVEYMVCLMEESLGLE